jgi:hypothetical protein
MGLSAYGNPVVGEELYNEFESLSTIPMIVILIEVLFMSF